MATLAQLEEGLKRAYNAGNMDYARILGAEIVRARGDRANLIPDTIVPGTTAQAAEQTAMDKVIGVGETALALGTGATAGTVGMVAGAAGGIGKAILDGTFGTPEAARAVEQAALKTSQAVTYAPRTQAGQDMTAAAGEVLSTIPPVIPLVGEAAAAGRAAVPAVAGAAATGGRAVKQVAAKAAQAMTPAPSGPAPGTLASIGSAGVDRGTIRAEKAANLPVPVRLTEGAKTRDADQLAFEKEQMKGPMGAPLRQRAEQNNLQALQNFDVLIDQVGAQSPDLATTGTALTKALSKGYDAAKNKTRVAYKTAENSKEAMAAVDVSPVIEHLNNIPTGLKTTALPDHAKQYAVRLGIASIGDDGRLIPQPTTVWSMEKLRKEISQATGFEPAEIRDAMILKKLIDAQTEPAAGPLYKKARAEREAQARKYENRAIVARLVNNKRGKDDPQVPVDEVFRRTILNGSPEEITFLKRVLHTVGKDGKSAWRELEGEMLRYFKNEATKGMGMDSGDNPIVSPAKLHQAVQQMDKNGRLDLVLGKQRAQIVRDLDDVVRYVSTVPPGTLINSSGTAAALMAAIAEAGATGAMTGIPVPALSLIRVASKGIKDSKIKTRINEALGDRK